MSRSPAPKNRPRPAAPRAPRAPRPAPDAPASTFAATALGFAVAAAVAGAFAWSSGCGAPPSDTAPDEPPPARVTALTATPSAPEPPPPEPTVAPVEAMLPDAGADAATDEKPYTGPLLGALALQTPIYEKPEFTKKRLGYIRLGGKAPVDPTPIKKGGSCTQGWYHLVDGGYVCGKYATLDMKNPQVRLGITPPNLDDVLPYKYAYNTAHGTPLYRSVPSKDDMIRYEPYLEASKRARKKEEREREKEIDDEDADKPAPASALSGGGGGGAGAKPTSEEVAAAAADRASALAAAAAIGILDGGAPVVEEAPAEPEQPWWQRKAERGKPLGVKLADLESESDGTIAKRMVKGFFVAVDKTFGWNNRQWHKTTSGLVAPADRMYIAKPPTSQGMDLPAGVDQAGFVTASKASKYEFDDEKKKVKVLGPVARFTAVGLTGETHSHKTVIYRKTTEGWWMKGIDGTFTEPGPRPDGVGEGDKWIDVNLTRKTLVLMEGERPVYAALISPGKRSKVKAKDHSTVQGTFHIREKHITTTMDGDGAASEDLPYSIEDVPYVAYFEGSYAVHAAFWHSNFGREMSHGCVNLSPLDAKRVFFWAGPTLPRGWHGVWATADNPGTTVVVHE
jgi:hypothetical protein